MIDHQVSTLTQRNNIRKIAIAICQAGKGVARKNISVLQSAKYLNTFYKLDLFEPYEYQLKWFRSGSTCLLRYLSAANQIGKTYGAAHEFAFHATGLYPSWWKGFRCGAGSLWAVGVSAESTRKVLQKELIGTNDARSSVLFGSGSIPRELIVWDSIVRRGEALVSLRVHHASGGESEIHFYSTTQDEAVFMGQKIVYAWIDEQSEKEIALIAQCTTRTINTGGCIAVTATPEIGVTEFYEQCRDDTSGEIHFQNATWDDAPHITAAVRASLLSRIPYYQRKLRSAGEPIMGVGKIYPFDDDYVTCAPFAIPDHWIVLAGLDFGYTGESDPSISVSAAYDPDTGKKYIFSEWSSEMDRPDYANSHMPDYMARKFIGQAPHDWAASSGKSDSEFDCFTMPSIAIIAPSDGDGIQPGTQKTRATIMSEVGANMCAEVWKLHPTQIPDTTNRVSKIGSIALLAQWFQDGDLKIFSTCIELMREFRQYRWVKDGRRTIPSPKNDHFMDAMRYAVTLVEFDGNFVYEARKNPDSGIYEVENPYEYDMGAYDL